MIKRLVLSAILALGTACPSLAQFASQMEWAGTAGGSPNAITITLPNAASMADLLGVPIKFLPDNTNTGATTLNVNNLGAKPVMRASFHGLVALSGGEIVSAPVPNPVIVIWDGNEFDIMSSFFAFPTPRNIRVLTSASGTYTPTAGAKVGIVLATGGGGSGGTGSAGQNGQGGGAGGTAVALVDLTTFSGGVPFTIGQGGASVLVNGADGLSGGATTLGSSPIYATATGGQGGSGQFPPNSNAIGNSGCGTQGVLLMCGGPGQPNTGGDRAGMGGNSFWGGGGEASYLDGEVGQPGMLGGGGGGGHTTRITSGPGGNGVIVVIEF